MTGDRVRIRDLVFEGGEGGEGFFFNRGGLSGWNDQTDLRREKNDRKQAHGVFRSPGYHDQRLIVIEGQCLTSSPEQQDWYSKRLSGLLNDGEYGRLTVDHQGTTLWADVGVYTQDWEVVEYGTIADYQIQLLAPDPFRYGETHTYGPAGPLGEIPVFHYGNAKAFPRFNVAGTISEDYAVYGPGTGDTRKRFKVNGTVSNGHPNLIDLKTGIVRVDGIQRRGVIEDATTWGVPGGTTISHTLDSNGDPATLTVTITDTYS
jgi:hypothetical protein